MELETVREHTGTDDYRTRLDILEDYAAAVEDEGGHTLPLEELNDIAHQVADQWPAVSYRARLVQWLQAGSPDLDEAPAVEHVSDVRELIGDDQARSLVRSIDEILGVMLYGVARSVIDDTIGDAATTREALEDLARTIGDHRARLNVTGYAMQPPYQWTLWHTYDQTARVIVEPRD